MRNARRRDGTGSPPRARRERGTVTGEPSALKGARWVRREAARKRPRTHRATGPRRAAHPVIKCQAAALIVTLDPAPVLDIHVSIAAP